MTEKALTWINCDAETKTKYLDAKRLHYCSILSDAKVRYAAQGVQGVKGVQGAQGVQGIQGVQGVSGISGAKPSIWYKGYKYDWDQKTNEYVRWVKNGAGPARPFTLSEAKEKDRKDGGEPNVLSYKGYAATQDGLKAFGDALKELPKEEELQNEKKDVYSLIANLCEAWVQENKNKYSDNKEYDEERDKAYTKIGSVYSEFIGAINEELKNRHDKKNAETKLPTFTYKGLTTSPEDLEKYKNLLGVLDTPVLELAKNDLLDCFYQGRKDWEKENKDILSPSEFLDQKGKVTSHLYSEREKFESLINDEIKRRKEQEKAQKEALKNHEFTFAHNGFEPKGKYLKAYAESLKSMPKSDLKKEYLEVNHSLVVEYKNWAQEAKKVMSIDEINEFHDLDYEPLREDAYEWYEMCIDEELERRDQVVKDEVAKFDYGVGTNDLEDSDLFVYNSFALNKDGILGYKEFLRTLPSQTELEDELKSIPKYFEQSKEAWKADRKDQFPSNLQDEYQEGVFALFDNFQKDFEQIAKREIARRKKKATVRPQKTFSIKKVEPYTPDVSSFPESTADVETVRDNIGGTTGAKMVKDANGNHYIMKYGASPEHITNEAHSDAFYQAAGVKVPGFKLYEDENGTPVKLATALKDTKPLDKWWNDASDDERTEMQKKLREGFAADVLLGNWDVVGDGDCNILVDPEGTPWRIDSGCSMGFRGRGERKPKEMWDNFCDELFTMTGNGAAIGNSVWNRVPDFFGKMRPLEIAQEITSRDWTDAIATLPESDAAVVKNRLNEVRQIAERGTENEKYGRTKESTDDVIAFSYQMCKDGIREALPIAIDLDENNYLKEWTTNVGWLCQGNEKHTLNGKEYDSLNEYLADKMGEDNFNMVEKINYRQGTGSYTQESLRRKLCIMKSQGLDFLDPKYSSFADFHDAATDEGYYCGAEPTDENYKYFNQAFDKLRDNPQEAESMCNAISQYDAVMQLILENVLLENADPVSRTFIVCRNEDAGIICDENGDPSVAVGERTYHKTGACDSHYHIASTFYLGEDATAMAVPFSRFHGLWCIQRGKSSFGSYQPLNGGQYDHDDENEASVDSHGLPKIFTGGQSSGSEKPSFQESLKIYKEWAQNNPDEAIQ